MEKEFITFDDAVTDLDVDAEDLKRMVSEGEIRAYRDHGMVKFRSDDLHTLKEGMDTEPSIELVTDASVQDEVTLAPTEEESFDLQVEPSSEFADLTVADFEDEVEIATPSIQEPEAPSLEDTVVGVQPEALDIKETAVSEPDEEETFVLAPDEDQSPTVALQMLDEEEEEIPQASTEVLGVNPVQTPEMLGIPTLATRTSPVLLAVLIVSTLVLFFCALLVIALISSSPIPATDWFTNLFKK